MSDKGTVAMGSIKELMFDNLEVESAIPDNMDEVEKEQFRKVNEEHNQIIAERTVRNFFSRILKVFYC